MWDVDGDCWVGEDKNGNLIFKTRAELEAERVQAAADKLRAETLYVSEEYKLFFITRQPGLKDDGRNAYISVKPFCTLDAMRVDMMRAKATPWEADSSAVAIAVADPQLVFHDNITKTDSSIHIGELDPDVRARLRFNQVSASAWDKFEADPAATVETIAVNRPLMLKRHVMTP